MVGRCMVERIECMYYRNNDRLYLAPINNEEVRQLYRTIDTKSMKSLKIDKVYSKHAYDLIYYTNVFFAHSCVVCEIDYYFDFNSDYDVTGIRLYSNELTSYVNPAEHYYVQKVDERNYRGLDLLYGFEILNSFSFTHKGNDVEARIVSGDILSRGIASELKLDTRLELVFSPTRDINSLINLCEIIHKALQILTYNRDVNYKSVELITLTDKGISIIGRLFFMKEDRNKRKRTTTLNSSYIYLKDYLGDILTTIDEDDQLYTKHLPKGKDDYITSASRLASIFAAFENEFLKLPITERLIDTEKIEKVRAETIKNIKKVNVSSDEEKDFRELVLQSVKNIGKQYGTRKKIMKAYELNEEALRSSFEMFAIDKSTFKGKIQDIVNIRNKIVHNNYDGEISNEFDFHIIEWITYAMFLNRCGIPANLTELALGRLFKCNSTEIRERLR